MIKKIVKKILYIIVVVWAILMIIDIPVYLLLKSDALYFTMKVVTGIVLIGGAFIIIGLKAKWFE